MQIVIENLHWQHMLFSLWLSLHFSKKLKLILENSGSFFLNEDSLKLPCALLPREGSFSLFHQTCLSTRICSFTPLSCRYRCLPFFLPSLTSVLRCYSWNRTLPELLRVVLLWRGRFKPPFRDRQRAVPFFSAFSLGPPTFLSPGLQQGPSCSCDSEQPGTEWEAVGLCKCTPRTCVLS